MVLGVLAVLYVLGSELQIFLVLRGPTQNLESRIPAVREAVPEGDDPRCVRNLQAHFRKGPQHLSNGFAHDFKLAFHRGPGLPVFRIVLEGHSGRELPNELTGRLDIEEERAGVRLPHREPCATARWTARDRGSRSARAPGDRPAGRRGLPGPPAGRRSCPRAPWAASARIPPGSRDRWSPDRSRPGPRSRRGPAVRPGA